MKKLHLIRHAKSSWSDHTLEDSQRPLNKRGIKSCAVMAHRINKAGCSFEHVFCSPAVRAQTTIQLIAQSLREDQAIEITWQTDNTLYTFNIATLLNWCRSLDETILEVVIVGHNNAITELANWVGDRPIENVPTCGYVQLAIADQPWPELSENSAQLVNFLKPKMFM